jgi:hypothetical protein
MPLCLPLVARKRKKSGAVKYKSYQSNHFMNVRLLLILTALFFIAGPRENRKLHHLFF